MDWEMVLGRAGFAAAICLCALAVLVLSNWLARRSSTGKLASLRALRKDANGRLVMVYFTTPECVPCKTVQEPAIREVQVKLAGDLEVVKIDATQNQSLADQWGVISVPTTFLVNSKGQVRRINRGVVRAERLLQQLEQI